MGIFNADRCFALLYAVFERNDRIHAAGFLHGEPVYPHNGDKGFKGLRGVYFHRGVNGDVSFHIRGRDDIISRHFTYITDKLVYIHILEIEFYCFFRRKVRRIFFIRKSAVCGQKQRKAYKNNGFKMFHVSFLCERILYHEFFVVS